MDDPTTRADLVLAMQQTSDELRQLAKEMGPRPTPDQRDWWDHLTARFERFEALVGKVPDVEPQVDGSLVSSD